MTTKITFNRQGKEISRVTDGLNPFERALIEKGFPQSRVEDLDRGFNALHRAICKLDMESLERLQSFTLEELLDLFAEKHSLRRIYAQE